MREIRNERFRQKLLSLLDGRADLMHFIHHLNYMVHAEPIANWLLTRGIKGANLSEWLEKKHGGSFIKAMQFIVQDVNRTNGVKPILIGRDYGRNPQT